jgi:CBS domain-containing protein
MNVSAILKLKGRNVATIAPGATLLETAKLLAQKKIGAVVVAGSDRAVVGILSERDIVRAVAESGPEVLKGPVDAVMTRNVITSKDSDSLDDLMKVMTRGRFRHLPVTDAQGKLAGIISIGDVVKFHVDEIKMEADALKDYIASH